MANLLIRVIDAYVFYQSKNGLEYLLLKRAKTKMYEHLWQGVAGKIEKNEQAWQAAIRELKEETGFDPSRIFIGGFSQGCMVALAAFLKYSGPKRLGGVLGLSGM